MIGISCKGTKPAVGVNYCTLHNVQLLYSPFFQCGKKNCQSGYSAYRVNIWGLLDPVRNKAENRNLTDQQVTNFLNHLKTSHGIERENVQVSDLPETIPPFPGTLTYFVHIMNAIYTLQRYFISKNQPGLRRSDPLKSSPGSRCLRLVSDFL